MRWGGCTEGARHPEHDWGSGPPHLLPSPPPLFPPRSRPPLSPTRLRWPPPKPWGQPASAGDQRTRRSWAWGRGGEFPTPAWACPSLPARLGGHRWGIPSLRARAGGPGERREEARRGQRLGPGAQLPSSPDTSCPCLSRAERSPFQLVARVRGPGVTAPGPSGRREGVKIQDGVRVSVSPQT